MQTKKFPRYLGVLIVLILGSLITETIDQLIGVKFTDVGVVANLIHKITYMLWGSTIFGVNMWFLAKSREECQ